MYFYRARYMDPKTGRFASFDPILHLANAQSAIVRPNEISFLDLIVTPQSLNPFSYSNNNPTTLVDPYGNAACVYSITLRRLICIPRNLNRVISCYAISGNNNLLDQNERNVGPIPLGIWSIGDTGDACGHL